MAVLPDVKRDLEDAYLERKKFVDAITNAPIRNICNIELGERVIRLCLYKWGNLVATWLNYCTRPSPLRSQPTLRPKPSPHGKTLCRKSRVFSRYFGFFPQGKLTE